MPVEGIEIRSLVVTGKLQNITGDVFHKFHYLVILDVSNNEIDLFCPTSVNGLQNLVELNLSHNNLKVVDVAILEKLTNVRYIFLQNNMITYIGNAICIQKTIQGKEQHSQNTFGLIHHLNVSNNKLWSLPLGYLSKFSAIGALDVHNNEVRWQTSDDVGSVKQVDLLVADSDGLCCISLNVRTCIAPVTSSPISDCYSMLPNTLFKGIVWVFGFFSMGLNTFVSLYRIWELRLDVKPHSFLMLNLSLVDLLMGFYMLMLGVSDVYYIGGFIKYRRFWIEGYFCKALLALSVMSSQMSLYFLCLISVFQKCTLSSLQSSNWKNTRFLGFLCLLGWVGNIIPLLVISIIGYYFNVIFVTNTCLIVSLKASQFNAAWISMVTLLVTLNLSELFTIAAMNACVAQVTLKSSKNLKRFGNIMNNRKAHHTCLLLFFFALCNFLCWLPVHSVMLYNLWTQQLNVALVNWFGIVVIPLSSLVNPCLYTLRKVLFN